MQAKLAKKKKNNNNTGCCRTKYGVADYQYFKNDNTTQCYILGHKTYNFLSSCV